MGSFNARTMVIGILECIGILSLACGKKRLHPLPRLQCQSASVLSGACGLAGTRATICLRELDLDDRSSLGILSRCPARADVTLRAGNCLCLPINGEMSQVIVSPRLIPVMFESGTN